MTQDNHDGVITHQETNILEWEVKWALGSITMNKASGEGNGTPLQYSCLENPMDGGAWWATVQGVAKSRTRLSDFTFTFHFHALEKEMATHSSVLSWWIPGTGEPGGLPSMGSHRVGHDWSDLAEAAAERKKETGCITISNKKLLCCSVTQSCLTLCDPTDYRVFHYFLEFAQTHVLWVGDAIQPHPLLLPSPPALNLSWYQGLPQEVTRKL